MKVISILKGTMQCLFLSLFVLVFAPGARAMTVQPDYVKVYEVWDQDVRVDFSIETTYSGIIGFAVGTNKAFSYGTVAVSNSEIGNWTGAAAVKKDGEGWKGCKYEEGVPSYFALPSFLDLNILPEKYEKAFVFYSSPDPLTSLETGRLITGFSGFSHGEDSTFVAFRIGEAPITGETSVPVPSSLVLLFGGVIGMVSFRRKTGC